MNGNLKLEEIKNIKFKLINKTLWLLLKQFPSINSNDPERENIILKLDRL